MKKIWIFVVAVLVATFFFNGSAKAACDPSVEPEENTRFE